MMLIVFVKKKQNKTRKTFLLRHNMHNWISIIAKYTLLLLLLF